MDIFANRPFPALCMRCKTVALKIYIIYRYSKHHCYRIHLHTCKKDLILAAPMLKIPAALLAISDLPVFSLYFSSKNLTPLERWVITRTPDGGAVLLQLQLHIVQLLFGCWADRNIHVCHRVSSRPVDHSGALWWEHKHSCKHKHEQLYISNADSYLRNTSFNDLWAHVLK